MQWIDFAELPAAELGISRLFTDFLTDHARLRPFLSRDFRDKRSWEAALKEVSSRSMDRSVLVRTLSRQNRDFQCGVRTLANIDLLLNENCVAVVTGQQVGLLGGPMYTLYKALTAIKLANKLAKEHPQYEFVPVFWLEGEDHDFTEVAQVQLITAANELATYRYELEPKLQGKNIGAVGRHAFGNGLEPFFTAVRGGITPTDFTEGAFNLTQSAYQPGMTLTRSFVHFLNNLLDDSGLIFIDPNDADLKKIVAPVFRKELEETPRVCQAVVDRSDQLEARYHAQVKPRSINAFLFHQGGRYAIEPHSQGYTLKGTRHTVSREEMFHLLDTTPEAFSPNVVLRPICQDTLLPTISYVAGPSEVAYFAQLTALYPIFGLPEPVIYPRSSLTIIEDRVEKVLTRFAISPLEVFSDLDRVKSRIALEVSDFKTDELFGSSLTSIEESLNSLRSGLNKIDPTLIAPLDATLGKIKSHVEVLRQKTLAAQQRQHEVFMRQVDKAALLMVPGGQFQERSLNVLYFLNKYGPEFVRWLTGELRIDGFKHQLIRL